MNSLFVILLSVTVILSGLFLIFRSGKVRHIEKKEMKAYIYLGLGFVAIGVGGTKLLLEVL